MTRKKPPAPRQTLEQFLASGGTIQKIPSGIAIGEALVHRRAYKPKRMGAHVRVGKGSKG